MGGDRDCYLPLLDVLDDGAPLTLSLTPVLCDQLEAPGRAGERFRAFLRDVRARDRTRTTSTGCARAGEDVLAAELERAARRLRARAPTRFEALGGDLLGALAPHARVDLGGDPRGAAAAGHRRRRAAAAGRRDRRATARRFGDAGRGGFWLPECAHAPWLDPLLEEAGVHATCVDLTDVLGRGAPAHLAPLRTAAGPLLVPIDRATIELVWSDRRLPRRTAPTATTTTTRSTTTGRGPTTARPTTTTRALALAREHAADFVARTLERLDARARSRRPGSACCALDTELLGHWWYEGADVAARGARRGRARRGSRSPTLDDALERATSRRRRAARPARDDVGHAARPLDLVRARRSPSSPGARARRRAARGRARGAAAPSARRARAAARCRRATGLPGHPRRSPAPYPRERVGRATAAALDAALDARLPSAGPRRAQPRARRSTSPRCSSREPAS